MNYVESRMKFREILIFLIFDVEVTIETGIKILKHQEGDQTLEQLLFTWEDSVENFFEYVFRCCGFGEETEVYQSLKLLISSIADLEVFINLYDGNMSDLKPTIEKMIQKNKLESLHI